MSNAKVQIGGGDDPHARYKRPRLQIKVEGAGNGIKTVLTNLEDIALHLHVDPEYPCKFFGMQLGVQSRSETQKLNSKASKNAKAVTRYIINGQHQAQLLEPLLVEFEKAFVCCPKCVAAEIRLAVSKKEVVTYDCRACGANGELPTKHKFLSYIAKHPPSKTVRDTVAQAPATRLMDGAKDEDDATESDKKVKSSKKGAEKEDEEVQWATDTSAEAQRKRMEEEMAAMTVKGADVVAGGKAAAAAASSTAAAEAKTPIAPAVDTKDLAPADAAAALFHAYMTVPASAAAIEAAKKAGKKKPSAFAHTADENVAELRRICLVRSLDDEHRIVVALKALLVATDKTKDEKSQNAAFPAAIETHAPTLRKLAAANKAAFLAGYELLVEQRSKLVGYVPHCMKALYDADVLEEDDIVTWHATPNANATNTSMRAKAKPFVDWLKNAEEDD